MHEFKFIRFVKFFLTNPYEEVYIRELAKKLRISPFATKKYADLLLKEELISGEKRGNLKYLKANINNLFYRQLKISYNLKKLLEVNLIKFIKDNVANTTSITLFGSLAKGDDSDKSDIDLVVIGKEKNLDFSKFENELNREISTHFFSWSEWTKKAQKDHPFYYEVITHGIPLYGELPIIKWK